MTSRAESCRVVLNHAESCRVVPSRAESCRVVPSRSESCRVMTSRHGTESCRVMPSRAESCRVVPSRAESCQVVSSHACLFLVVPIYIYIYIYNTTGATSRVRRRYGILGPCRMAHGTDVEALSCGTLLSDSAPVLQTCTHWVVRPDPPRPGSVLPGPVRTGPSPASSARKRCVYVMVMLSQSRWTVSSRGQVGPILAGPGRTTTFLLDPPGPTPQHLACSASAPAARPAGVQRR
jgi:hypothetical protein